MAMLTQSGILTTSIGISWFYCKANFHLFLSQKNSIFLCSILYLFVVPMIYAYRFYLFNLSKKAINLALQEAKQSQIN